MGNGITHLYLSGVLDTRDDISHLACSQLVAGYHVHLQHADLVGIIFHSGVEELHLVALADGSIFDAALVGYDAEQDLAVIKAQDTDGRAAQGLPAAEFGDSDALSVGDPVYAIGNPLGVELRGTLTDGIVSAINRDVAVDGVTMTLIQTNAALNNGNSGGPLINVYGQVVGINTMKMGSSSTTSVEGLGFAIPISSTAYMINDLIAHGEVRVRRRRGHPLDASRPSSVRRSC